MKFFRILDAERREKCQKRGMEKLQLQIPRFSIRFQD